MKKAFSNRKYMNAQSLEIANRIGGFSKLYLEVGGFISGDVHASRVLPGYDPDTKLDFLSTLKNADIIYCVNAQDIERQRRRNKGKDVLLADFVIGDLEKMMQSGLNSPTVAITMYREQERALKFMQQLHDMQLQAFTFDFLTDYPGNLPGLLSDSGFGRYHLIGSDKDLVVVTGSGGNSGKMGLALSQIYLQMIGGNKCGFAKFETFPVWNLAYDHPLNIAYEFATVTSRDDNQLDELHYNQTGVKAVTYSRDIGNYRVLRSLMIGIFGEVMYESPTQMGINMVKEGIIDDGQVRTASMIEIERRIHFFECEKETNPGNFQRSQELIDKYGL